MTSLDQNRGEAKITRSEVLGKYKGTISSARSFFYWDYIWGYYILYCHQIVALYTSKIVNP